MACDLCLEVVVDDENCVFHGEESAESQLGSAEEKASDVMHALFPSWVRDATDASCQN